MSPRRFFLIVAIPFGLFVIFAIPPWGGADEHVHFARTIDIAEGRLEPASGTCPMMVPRTYQTDTSLVANSYLAGNNPVNFGLLGDLLGSAPDGDDKVCFDIRPTSATSALPYLPSAIGVALPHAVGAPAIITVWMGRLFNLAAYIGLAATALSAARAFRWTLALAATFPMAVTFGATITPDGITAGAFLLVISVWTRLLDKHLPPSRALIEVGLAGGLLALSKPPYFLVLAIFPLLLWRGATEARKKAAIMGGGLMVVGGALTVANSASNYRPPNLTLTGRAIRFRPDKQRQQILDDPLGYAETLFETWVTEYPDYVRDWAFQLGTIRIDMPVLFAWLMLLGVMVAVLRLDTHDYERIANVTRLGFFLGTIAFVIALYTSAYVYFDDTVAGDHIGGQMARYTLPLLSIFAIGFFPRWDRITWPIRRRLNPDQALTLLGTSLFVVMGGFVLTTLWWGVDLNLASP